MRDDRERLRDVIDAIGAIRRHTRGGKAEFDREELIRVWCLRHIEVIGEAVARLSDETRALHPEAPWREIIGMRNLLIHGYFDVEWDQVWTVVERDLAPLEQIVRSLLPE